MRNLNVGDRVYWQHTQTYIRSGTVKELNPTRVGVLPDCETSLLYLNPAHLYPVNLWGVTGGDSGS